MSPAGIIYWSDVLLYIMQGSILVPMAVAWVYRQRFSPPVRLLTWYVYWSLACSAGARLATLNHLSNYGFIAAFNTGKLLLFGLVYYRVLAHRAWRRWVAGFTLITSAGILVVALSDLYLAMVVARVAQCTLLAGFAMAYGKTR
jgi:Mg2+/citrate symporter